MKTHEIRECPLQSPSSHPLTFPQNAKGLAEDEVGPSGHHVISRFTEEKSYFCLNYYFSDKLLPACALCAALLFGGSWFAAASGAPAIPSEKSCCGSGAHVGVASAADSSSRDAGDAQKQSDVVPAGQVDAVGFPKMLRSGWMLNTVERMDRPHPLFRSSGWQVTYRLAAPNGYEFGLMAWVLEEPDEETAAREFAEFAKASDLPQKAWDFSAPEVRLAEYRQGRQDSPAASPDAQPLEVTRITLWAPPRIIVLEAQVAEIGVAEVKDFLFLK
jgi:hypothetical protein